MVTRALSKCDSEEQLLREQWDVRQEMGRLWILMGWQNPLFHNHPVVLLPALLDEYWGPGPHPLSLLSQGGYNLCSHQASVLTQEVPAPD